MGTIRVLPAYYSPIGKQALTVSSSAVGFTLPATPQVRAVLLTVEYTVASTDYLRYWATGDAPTASDGQALYHGDILEITNVDMINNFQAIAVGNDMKLMIQYFGGGV